MEVQIDGSYKEGGGQILRTSLAFSSILKKPTRIYNIRKNREPQGLKIQHYHSVKLLKKITRAEIDGLYIGSTEIKYNPKGIFGGSYKELIPTAGSISLVLQLILPVIVFANRESKIIIGGGTDVKHSPSMDYVDKVIIPYFERFAKINLKIIKRGFYPKGGGLIELKVNPKIHRDDYHSFDEFIKELRSNIAPLELYNNTIESIEIYTVASRELKNRNVGERINKTFVNELSKTIDIKIKKHKEYVNTLSIGVVSTVVIRKSNYVTGFDVLGEKRLSSEEIGKILANRVIDHIKSGVNVDDNLADNLVPIISLIGGRYLSKNLTGHLETNIWVVNKFLPNSVNYTLKNGGVLVKSNS